MSEDQRQDQDQDQGERKREREDAALSSMPDTAVERYARHLVMPQIGPSGQAALMAARVAIVGVGGIGCPLAQSLAASGVGTLTLIDDDMVSTSNLSRQILFEEQDVGRPKVQAAHQALAANNTSVQIQEIHQRLTDQNAGQALAGHDLVIDVTDTHESRMLVSNATHDLGIALISASVLGTQGQIALFSGNTKRRYAQLFPSQSQNQATCADAGVLSSGASMIGAMAASLAIQGLVNGNDFASLDGKCALIGTWPPSVYWIS